MNRLLAHAALYSTIIVGCGAVSATTTPERAIVLPQESLFRESGSADTAFVCTIESHSISSPPTDNIESGTVVLHVVQALAPNGSPKRELTTSYQVRRTPAGWIDTNAAPFWRDFATLPKDQLVLVSFQEKISSNAPEPDAVVDLAYLNGPDDPAIAEAHLCLALKATTDVDKLSSLCKRVTEGHHGYFAMRLASLLAIQNLAQPDPASALSVLVERTRSPELIEPYEQLKIVHWLSQSHAAGRSGKNLLPALEVAANLASAASSPPQSETVDLLAKIVADSDVATLTEATQYNRDELLFVLKRLSTDNHYHNANITSIMEALNKLRQ